jgi:MFS transporter, DHA1 family, inner membrane transport protein
MTQDVRRFHLLTVHYAVRSLAMSLAGGFVGAYLLRLGFRLQAAVAVYAALYLSRFVIRFGAAAIVRCLGIRTSLLMGAALGGLQFLPLLNADRPLWLIAWVLTVCAGESIYFPVYRAASAVCGGDGRRGRQMAGRLLVGTAISIGGPIVGGALLSSAGPIAGFGLASVVCLGSVVPLLRLGDVDVGRLPSIGQAIRLVDRTGIAAVAADGWISAGTSIVWSMILFTSLSSSFGAFGLANSVAALAGAVVGLLCGERIDQGHNEQVLPLVAAGLVLAVGLRVAAAWLVGFAPVANAFGAAITGVYCPLLMSVVYDRAKRTGQAYHFHLCAEAGWDVGMMSGCLAIAALIWTGMRPPLTILPSLLGIASVFWCLRAGRSAAGRAAMVHIKGGFHGAPQSRPVVVPSRAL